jgi:endoglucanase
MNFATARFLGRHRGNVRGVGERRLVTVVVLLLLTALAGCGGHKSSVPSSPAEADATYFLSHYESADGRVVRWDQGGDTVSEGQAYAMLTAVAIGDRARFVAAWDWGRANLLQPDGLMAWHWDDGRVLDTQSASDADVDAASALALAGSRFQDPAYTAAAKAMAAAIAAHEVAVLAGGDVLTAGPWADTSDPVIDPSYDAPLDFDALAGLAGASAEWQLVEEGTRAEVAQVLRAEQLPPDWAVIDGQGQPVPTSGPASSSGPGLYGIDAVRVPIRLAASCNASDRQMAAGMWRLLSGPAQDGKPLVGLDLDGAPSPSVSNSPIGLVGAAAAARAGGQTAAALTLLDRADSANQSSPTYYTSAWLALARILLQTHLLGGCAASASAA